MSDAHELIDWNKVPEDGPPPLEDFVYGIEVAKATREKSKKGEVQIKLEIKTTHRFGDEPGSLKRKCFDYLNFGSEALFRVRQCCKALNVEPPASRSADDLDEFVSAITGATGYARTRQESYTKNGETKSSVKIDRYLDEDAAAEAAQVMIEAAE